MNKELSPVMLAAVVLILLAQSIFLLGNSWIDSGTDAAVILSPVCTKNMAKQVSREIK